MNRNNQREQLEKRDHQTRPSLLAHSLLTTEHCSAMLTDATYLKGS